MYVDYFQLNRRPFELLPDSDFLYLTPQHAKAIANIEFALMNRDSFVIITGEVGIGKTTILNKMARELPDSLVLARVTHTTLSPVELLQAILSEFGRPCYKKNRVYLLDQLKALLQELADQDRHAVIMVDEAQNLGNATLEELRLLSCIDSDTRKLVSIVLVGQPILNEIIDSPEHKNLRDRTRLRQHLDAMDSQETRDYVRFRLDIAGGRLKTAFTRNAIKLIYQTTRGIPRLINTLCDTAMTAACVENSHKVTADIMDATLEELHIESPERSNGLDEGTGDYPSPFNWPDNDGLLSPMLDYELQTLAGFDPPWFMVYRGGEYHGKVFLDRFPFLIGRDNTNSFTIDCPSVSRRHAVVVKNSEENIVIEDLCSTNGTIVNDIVRHSNVLENGDIVNLGHYELIYFATQEREASTSAVAESVTES